MDIGGGVVCHQAEAPAFTFQTHPVEDDIMLYVMPVAEGCVFQTAPADIERSALVQLRRCQCGREIYVQMISVIIESSFRVGIGIFLPGLSNTWISLPVYAEVQVNVMVSTNG